MQSVELDRFGSFPHPKGIPHVVSSPILFLVPPASTYVTTHDTYVHFFELSGGCTGHYIEKGYISYFLMQDAQVDKYVSDISIVAGEIDIFVKSQIPRGKSPKPIQDTVETAKERVNEWLASAEVEKEKFRSVQINLCPYKANPMKIKKVHYDWGVSYTSKGTNAHSYYVTDLDLGNKINSRWFLGEETKQVVREAVLKNEEFRKKPQYEQVLDGELFPIYIPPLFLNSLLVHFWIEFRDSSVNDLTDVLENPTDSGMSREMNAVRDFLFRILAIESDEAFVSFMVPDLSSLYKVFNAVHQVSRFHRIRSRIVTHSFRLRPPFIMRSEVGNENTIRSNENARKVV